MPQPLQLGGGTGGTNVSYVAQKVKERLSWDGSSGNWLRSG